jgi:protein subunit release factor A
VAFPTNVEHECLPIIEGIRYVFKSKLNLCKVKPLTIELSLAQTEIDNYIKKISNYENKIQKINQKIERIHHLKPSEETINLVKKITKNSDKQLLIILDRYYSELDPNYLICEDRHLYNKIWNYILQPN